MTDQVGLISSSPTLCTWAGETMTEARELRVAGGTAVVFTQAAPASPGRINQDALTVIGDDEATVFGVADGAGGLPAGERAASAAIDSLRRRAAESMARGGSLREGVFEGFEDAGKAVQGMGVGAATTLLACEVQRHGVLRTYHTGDSRALVCGQRGKLKLLTMAHSPVGYQVQAGLLAEEEALHHEGLHIVENLIGMQGARVEVGPSFQLAPRDTLVAGSDGLFDNLSPEEVVAAVRHGSLRRAALALASSVSRRMTTPEGGQPSKPDDVAFVLFRRG